MPGGLFDPVIPIKAMTSPYVSLQGQRMAHDPVGSDTSRHCQPLKRAWQSPHLLGSLLTFGDSRLVAS
ncbi:MAG: hypothetical protein P8X64_10010, partial [Anaerolineales bacterium]